MAEDFWIERAQSAEARLATVHDNQERLKEKLRGMMETLGAKERSDGTIDIDFEILADRLGPEKCLELRKVIDDVHQISGAPGEKPRIRLSA